jgi:hypothetical protein
MSRAVAVCIHFRHAYSLPLKASKLKFWANLIPSILRILKFDILMVPPIVWGPYTVIIFLARNGQIRAVKFRPKNFGRSSFDLGEISPNQQILRLNNGRNSPEIFEGEPQLRGFARFARKNIYFV